MAVPSYITRPLANMPDDELNRKIAQSMAAMNQSQQNAMSQQVQNSLANKLAAMQNQAISTGLAQSVSLMPQITKTSGTTTVNIPTMPTMDMSQFKMVYGAMTNAGLTMTYDEHADYDPEAIKLNQKVDKVFNKLRKKVARELQLA